MKEVVSCKNNISSKYVLPDSTELGKSVHLLFLGQTTEYFWSQRAASHLYSKYSILINQRNKFFALCQHKQYKFLIKVLLFVNFPKLIFFRNIQKCYETILTNHCYNFDIFI